MDPPSQALDRRPGLEGLFDLQIIISTLPVDEGVRSIDPTVSGFTQARCPLIWIFVCDVANTSGHDDIFREVIRDFHIDQDFAAKLLLDQALRIDCASWAFEDADRLGGQAIGCSVRAPIMSVIKTFGTDWSVT